MQCVSLYSQVHLREYMYNPAPVMMSLLSHIINMDVSWYGPEGCLDWTLNIDSNHSEYLRIKLFLQNDGLPSLTKCIYIVLYIYINFHSKDCQSARLPSAKL